MHYCTQQTNRVVDPLISAMQCCLQVSKILVSYLCEITASTLTRCALVETHSKESTSTLMQNMEAE